MNHRWQRILLAGLFCLIVTGPARAVLADGPVFQVRDTVAQQGDRPLYVPGQLLVRFRPTVQAKVRTAILAGHNASVVRALLLPDVYLVQVDGRTPVLKMAETLRQEPAVVTAEPNYYRYAAFIPNDPYYSYQWSFPMIQMEPAWDRSQGTGVTIAVIDTGIAYETYGVYVQAPDLAGTTFVPGWDFVNNDAHPNDDYGHGTHVSGTLAQTTNNSYGLAGIAHNARLMPLKVLNDQGKGNDQVVADAIVWATDHGAQVLNLSLGGTSAGSVLRQAVDYAYDHGVVVVAAAGNGSCHAVEYPAAYANAIAVAAVRFDKTRAYYSNCGPELDVAAPGGDLNVDQNGDGYGDGILQQTFSPGKYGTFGYWFYHGTSMATPHVAALAALLISQGYAVTPDAVRAVLAHTAQDLGAAGFDNEYGWGLIQADDALTYAALATATATATPSPSPTATASSTASPTTTPSPTATATPSPTATATASPTHTATATASPTATPSATPTPVPCTLPGDVNCDCTVDIVDIMTVASRWGATAGDPLYDAAYDFDSNGVIDIVDIMFVATRFMDQCAVTGG